MDTVRLAEVLNYQLRHALGAGVDYQAYLLPNELAIRVIINQPEYLRGLDFIFREGEPLPAPIRRAERLLTIEPIDPNRYVTFNVPPEANMRFTHVDYGITVGTGGEVPMPLRVRTEEEQVFYTRIADLNNRGIAVPQDQWERFTHLRANTSERIMPVPRPANIRTPEQEDRLRDLDEAGNHREFTPEERMEYDRLHSMMACPAPNPPRIYVRVHRSAGRYGGNEWDVTVRVGTDQRELPPISVIKSLINPADKHFLPSRQGRRHSTLRLLRTSLEAGLSVQSLHDALRAWAMATENRVTSAESVMPTGGIDQATANLLRAQPATLEVGGRVYRLVPSHEIDVRPLITRVRQRTLAATQVEATAITDRARTDARVLTTEAERAATRLRQEAEIAARLEGVRVPNWVRDSKRPHYWNGSHWVVQMEVACKVRDIRLYIARWGLVLHWKPLTPRADAYYESYKMPVYFRIGEDGRWDSNNIYNKVRPTTHIYSYMCMDLQGLPSRVSNFDHLRLMEDIIGRGMQVINLNSPLNTAIESYWPDFREQIPPTVSDWLSGRIHIDPPPNMSKERWQEANPSIKWDSEETIQEEESRMFNVNSPVPTLPVAVPEINPQLQELAEMIQTAQAATAVPERRR